MSGMNPILVCLLGLWLLHSTNGIKITSLDVPRTAWESVKLNCRYDLEGEALYAVKWYKDGREFFRCLADGTVLSFQLRDIKIYHSETSQLGSCFFELTALTAKSGGVYMCEVSLDWPTFQTISQSAVLHITEPSQIAQTNARSAEIEEEIATETSDGVRFDHARAAAHGFRFLPKMLVILSVVVSYLSISI